MLKLNSRSLFRVAHITCAFSFFLFSVSARAQFRAGIEGTVTDASGAAVVGVTVTVSNQETGKSAQLTTSGAGFYRISGLPPGKYTVTALVTGFKEKVVKDITVHAEEMQGINITIEPGPVNETVTVTGETVPQLQTENGNVTGAITNQQVHALPQVGRDPYELLRLAPGVFGDGARAGNGNSVGLPNTSGPGGSNSSLFQTENQVPISGGGQRLSNNNFEIDGVSVNSLGWGGAAVVTPNQESVKEIRVTTNAYDAQYGRNSGAHIEVVSQNGTNQFHGSGFFKYDEPGLNAFNKYGGPSGARPQRVEKKLRNFGGSVGGPVVKEKLFFFFSYEGLRNRSTNFSTPTYVETAQYRQRVISARPDGITAKILGSPGMEPRIAQVIPAPCPIDSTGKNGFKPGTCQQVAGGLDIGSLTSSLGQYVDAANTAGGGLDGVPDVQQVILALPSQTRGSQWNARMDFNRGRNDSFAVSTYFTRLDSLGSDSNGRSRPMQDTRFKPFNSATTLTYNRVLSPVTLNQARINFTRFSANQLALSPNPNWGIPRLEVDSLPPFSAIGLGPNRTDTTPALFAQNTIEFRDTLSRVIRTHALKFGAEIRKEQDNNNLLGGARPLYRFRGLWNLANDAPYTESIDADPNTGSPTDAQRYFRTGDYGLFAQDDWKLRPNLTLNLGLRWEYFAPLREHRGHLSNLVLGPNGLQDARVAVVNELFRPDRTNFAPRFGFAYSPPGLNSKLVVRGGFGLFYNRIPDVLFSNTRANPPFFSRYSPCCLPENQSTVGGKVLYALGASSSPMSYPVNPALAFGLDPRTGAPCLNQACTSDSRVEIWGAQPNMENAYIYEYSFGLEYSLPHSFVAALGYEGSAGHKLIRLVNLQFLFPENTNFAALRFPQPDTNSNFNALNARLTHRFAKGFQAQARYRYSKSIDQLSYEGPGAGTNQTYPQDDRTERGPSDYDATHHFNLSGLWDLPIFPHRRDLVGKVLGGWQISAILTAHSGFPWTPVSGTSVSTPGGPSLSPTRPVAQIGTPLTDHSNDAFTRPSGNFPGGGRLYFDTSSGPPGIGRNSFRGPHYFGTDLSLGKEFRLLGSKYLGEAARIDVRANFFNVFNQLNLKPFLFDSNATRIERVTFGQADSGLSGRVIEFQVRLSF